MKRVITTLIVMLTLLCSTMFASAAADPAVVIVNPANQSCVYSDSFLISIKVTQPKTICVKVFEQKKMVDGVPVSIDVNNLIKSSQSGGEASGIDTEGLTNVSICEPEQFTSTNALTFVTKQVNELKPGLYLVQVETIDSAGNALYHSQAQVAVMGKQSAEEQSKIFDTPQGGALQFFQNLLKNIFK